MKLVRHWSKRRYRLSHVQVVISGNRGRALTVVGEGSARTQVQLGTFFNSRSPTLGWRNPQCLQGFVP